MYHSFWPFWGMFLQYCTMLMNCANVWKLLNCQNNFSESSKIVIGYYSTSTNSLRFHNIDVAWLITLPYLQFNLLSTQLNCFNFKIDTWKKECKTKFKKQKSKTDKFWVGWIQDHSPVDPYVCKREKRVKDG